MSQRAKCDCVFFAKIVLNINLIWSETSVQHFFRVILLSRIVSNNDVDTNIVIVRWNFLSFWNGFGIDSISRSFLAVHCEQMNEYDSGITHIYAAINIINRRVVLSLLFNKYTLVLCNLFRVPVVRSAASIR